MPTIRLLDFVIVLPIVVLTGEEPPIEGKYLTVRCHRERFSSYLTLGDHLTHRRAFVMTAMNRIVHNLGHSTGKYAMIVLLPGDKDLGLHIIRRADASEVLTAHKGKDALRTESIYEFYNTC